MCDEAGVEGVSLEGGVDGGGELLRPVVVERGSSRVACGRSASPRSARRWKRAAVAGTGDAERVAGGADVGLAGGGEQASRCAGSSTVLSGVVGAAMAGELGLLVKDADSGVAGEQGQELADVGVGDGVEIVVEADVGGLAGADDAHEFGLEGMGGER